MGFTGRAFREGSGAFGFFKGGGFAGPAFDDGAGGFKLGKAGFAPGDFALDRKTVLERGAVGGLGFGEKLGDFGFEGGDEFAGFAVTRGCPKSLQSMPVAASGPK